MLSSSIVVDPLEIRRLLSRACEGGNTWASLKPRGSEPLLRARLMDVDPMKDGIQLAFSHERGAIVETGSNRSLGEEARGHECLVLIYLSGRSIVGFCDHPWLFFEDRLVFRTPSKLFKIQRRKAIRFTIPTAYAFNVETESLLKSGTKVIRRLFDISEGGLSFLVPTGPEAPLFRRGMILKDCRVILQGQRLPVSLRISGKESLSELSEATENKIGAEFIEITRDDRNFLAQFVYAHAEHLFFS